MRREWEFPSNRSRRFGKTSLKTGTRMICASDGADLRWYCESLLEPIENPTGRDAGRRGNSQRHRSAGLPHGRQSPRTRPPPRARRSRRRRLLWRRRLWLLSNRPLKPDFFKKRSRSGLFRFFYFQSRRKTDPIFAASDAGTSARAACSPHRRTAASTSSRSAAARPRLSPALRAQATRSARVK